MKFCSFASSSSGNCYMVSTEESAMLIDVGISGKRILEGLENTRVPREKVKGILLTHEHIDHIKSLRVIGKKIPQANAYATVGTWGHIDELISLERQVRFPVNSRFEVGDMHVKSFRISHDAAEPTGYTISDGNHKICIATDTGCITDEMYSEAVDADLLVLEANHEIEILKMCSYPYKTKRRILGDEGHLSNVSAGECLCRILRENPKKRRVLLAHLSGENNTPDIAMLTVRNILEEKGLFPGVDLEMDVIRKDLMSPLYVL